MDYEKARAERKLQLQELENLRLEAYENSKLYKEKNAAHARQAEVQMGRSLSSREGGAIRGLSLEPSFKL
ncbi:hypothetical protein AHAS_Ahas07G0032300 [Arachis hypogaea]